MKALFQYVSKLDGYDWNPHKSSRGNTMSERRFLVSEDGVQKPYIKIVSDSDPVNDDEFDPDEYFANLKDSI